MLDEPSDDKIEELAAEAMVLALSSGLSLNEAARAFGTASRLLAALETATREKGTEEFVAETVRWFKVGTQADVAVPRTATH